MMFLLFSNACLSENYIHLFTYKLLARRLANKSAVVYCHTESARLIPGS